MKVLTKKPYPESPVAILELHNGFQVKYDPEFYPLVNKYHWFVKKSFRQWYAVAWTKINGKRKLIRMHRLIAKTPKNLIVHHINGDSLDNRIDNLMNITEFEHAKYFSYR